MGQKFIKAAAKTGLMMIVFMMLVACGNDPIKEVQLLSPDGLLEVKLEEQEGALFYQVFYKKQQVINASRLGLKRSDADFSANLKLKNVTETPISQSYQLSAGKILQVDAEGKSYEIEVGTANNREMTIEVQTYNEGFAFRYVFPENSTEVVSINEDLTEIAIAGEGEAWLQPYDQPTKWTPAYENYFEKVAVHQPSPIGAGWSFPALFKTNGTWVLISDGGIDGDYVGIHLQADSANNKYIMRWPEPGEALGLYENTPSSKLPWQTSWKTFAVSDKVNDILASNLVKHVSPESRVANTSWIKPGLASWSWLVDHDSPQDFDKLKSFVDLAANMGWPYSLVDANWNVMKGGDLAQLAEYATSKGVGLLVWYNSGGPNNEVEEMPRDIMSDSEKRKEAFQMLQSIGVKGVKIDFFQSDKQPIMKLYKDILEDAAKYEIMVNFHGCSIPRGWARTYPHLVTMESVRGAECYSFSDSYTLRAPVNNTILPFTRNVLGSMDATPVMFEDNTMPHVTTYAHELALPVIFESGWTHFADGREAYEGSPEYVREFLSNVPTAWDEIKYIQGTPGEDVVLARRKADKWYIAGINGEAKEKQWNIDLSFLGKNATVDFIGDGELTRSFKEEKGLGKLQLTIQPYGGFVAVSAADSE